MTDWNPPRENLIISEMGEPEYTVEALLSHTPPSHEKCMGYEGLWEDRERLHARLAGISVPNVMKGINGQSKGIRKSLGMS